MTVIWVYASAGDKTKQPELFHLEALKCVCVGEGKVVQSKTKLFVDSCLIFTHHFSNTPTPLTLL